jgi:hypothetical protein
MEHMPFSPNHIRDFVIVGAIQVLNIVAAWLPHDYANGAHIASIVASLAVIAKVILERRDRWQEKNNKNNKRKTK